MIIDTLSSIFNYESMVGLDIQYFIVMITDTLDISSTFEHNSHSHKQKVCIYDQKCYKIFMIMEIATEWISNTYHIQSTMSHDIWLVT